MYPLSRDIYSPAPYDPNSLFGRHVQLVQSGTGSDTAAQELYAQLTAAERLQLLHGNVKFWPGRGRIMDHGYNYIPFVMGQIEDRGIPGLHFIDGPRGAVVGATTAFPVSMARGATWDDQLEEEIGRAIGREVRATGGNLFGGVCINIPRHPAWGRIQETYSDQSVLLGKFGAALVRGVNENAMSCVKHFALNSMENARFDVDVVVDEATMHEHYLPHFNEAIGAGAQSVMCAYNSVNGEWASANHELLTNVLRNQWGFEGFVLSDFIWAIRDVAASLEAGMDVEAPFNQLRGTHLREALDRGETSWDVVETSALRVLKAQLDHYAHRSPIEPGMEVIAGDQHTALAREAAVRSMVLLKNTTSAGTPLLPAGSDSVRSIAVFGRLADVINLGDKGSSNVKPPHATSILEGITAAYPDAQIIVNSGENLESAKTLAATVDLALVCVGYTAAEEGEWVNGRVYARDDLMKLYPEPTSEDEQAVLNTMLERLEAAKDKPEIGGDRASLRLLPHDEQLILAVSQAQENTVAVVQAAGAVLTTTWEHAPAAIVLMWYAGMEGGNALGDLLSGTRDFTGRLPFVMVKDESDLPPFDMFASSATYDRWFSNRLITRNNSTPAYPLGFGLSYRTADIVEISAPVRDGLTGSVSVRVRNPHSIAVDSVVQVYGVRSASPFQGERELLGFSRVAVPAQATTEAVVELNFQPISVWNASSKTLELRPQSLNVEASRFWGDPNAVSVSHQI